MIELKLATGPARLTPFVTGGIGNLSYLEGLFALFTIRFIRLLGANDPLLVYFSSGLVNKIIQKIQRPFAHWRLHPCESLSCSLIQINTLTHITFHFWHLLARRALRTITQAIRSLVGMTINVKVIHEAITTCYVRVVRLLTRE